MTTDISNSYNTWKDTLNFKSTKLKSYYKENISYYSAVILVYYERLESASYFNTKHLGYTNNIFEDISDYIYFLWMIQKQKEVTELTKVICETWI